MQAEDVKLINSTNFYEILIFFNKLKDFNSLFSGESGGKYTRNNSSEIGCWNKQQSHMFSPVSQTTFTDALRSFLGFHVRIEAWPHKGCCLGIEKPVHKLAKRFKVVAQSRLNSCIHCGLLQSTRQISWLKALTRGNRIRLSDWKA